MIQLTRLNRVPLIVNADLIEHVEVTPDTVVALTTGQKFMVLESPEELVDKVIQFRKMILASMQCPLQLNDVPLQPASQAQPAGEAHPKASKTNK
jgi:flagellar protein FlbD